jgi:hypothetical protein
MFKGTLLVFGHPVGHPVGPRFCSDSYFDAARRGQCVNSVARRMSGAHAPRSAVPHMSRQGCGPGRCVHRAASGSRRPGVGNATTRTQIRVGCRARTHWRAACKWGGAASSVPLCEPLQACLALVRIFWRRTGGRRVYDRTQTVAAACNPLGETPIVSHGRKEGTVAVPTHASDVGWFPQSPPPFPPVALDRAFCRARRRRDPCNPMSLVWRCCELARDTRMYAYGIAPRGHGQAFAALHRSCQVSPKVGRLKRGPFRDRSNADLHACVRV